MSASNGINLKGTTVKANSLKAPHKSQNVNDNKPSDRWRHWKNSIVAEDGADSKPRWLHWRGGNTCKTVKTLQSHSQSQPQKTASCTATRTTPPFRLWNSFKSWTGRHHTTKGVTSRLPTGALSPRNAITSNCSDSRDRKDNTTCNHTTFSKSHRDRNSSRLKNPLKSVSNYSRSASMSPASATTISSSKNSQGEYCGQKGLRSVYGENGEVPHTRDIPTPSHERESRGSYCRESACRILSHPRELESIVSSCDTEHRKCSDLRSKRTHDTSIVQTQKSRQTQKLSTKSENSVTFLDEFEDLEQFQRQLMKTYSFTAAEHNLDKNRFRSILAPDDSRVTLAVGQQAGDTDYYNANYISLGGSGHDYIAAQSPFSQETSDDFWRLLIQTGVETVVMMDDLVEQGQDKGQGRGKCHQYWSDDGVFVGGASIVVAEDVDRFANLVIRKLKVTSSASLSSSSKQEHSRVLTQFQFTAWPRSGVLDDPLPLLELRYHVRKHHSDMSSPILVHCATGTARTAVFIAVDYLIDEYDRDGSVHVYQLVKDMRRNRPHMVRSLQHYIFIYKCLFEEFEAGDTFVDLNLRQKYTQLKKRNPYTGHSYLKDQFLLLATYTSQLNPQSCREGGLPRNKDKNRVAHVLPPDKYRPRVKEEDGDRDLHGYINAVYVDGLRSKGQYIITQTPSADTAADFWLMVYHHQIETIVHLGNCEGFECYYPVDDSETVTYHPLTVECVSRTHNGPVVTHDLKLSKRRGDKMGTRRFQLDLWENEDDLKCPRRVDEWDDGKCLLHLMDLFSKWQTMLNNDSHPILVVCTDGLTNSGLLVACTMLSQRMRELGHADIYHTVKHIRRRRPEVIVDYHQYDFIYKVISQYIKYYLGIPHNNVTSREATCSGLTDLNLIEYRHGNSSTMCAQDDLHDSGKGGSEKHIETPRTSSKKGALGSNNLNKDNMSKQKPSQFDSHSPMKSSADQVTPINHVYRDVSSSGLSSSSSDTDPEVANTEGNNVKPSSMRDTAPPQLGQKQLKRGAERRQSLPTPEEGVPQTGIIRVEGRNHITEVFVSPTYDTEPRTAAARRGASYVSSTPNSGGEAPLFTPRSTIIPKSREPPLFTPRSTIIPKSREPPLFTPRPRAGPTPVTPVGNVSHTGLPNGRPRRTAIVDDVDILSDSDWDSSSRSSDQDIALHINF